MSFDLAEFFVLRSPALPAEELMMWAEGLSCFLLDSERAPEEFQRSWARDVDLTRLRLLEIVQRPEIQQALFVASPTLYSSIGNWQLRPESKKGRQTERSLVRYFSRMCGRSTPFGLFSGLTLGRVTKTEVGRATLSLEARDRTQTKTRLDYTYLFSLAAAIETDKEIAKTFRYRANSSLHKHGVYWHYIETKPGPTRFFHIHDLVKVMSDPLLDRIVEKTTDREVSFDELVRCVVEATKGEASPGETSAYIHELIESKVLVSSLHPRVTGDSPAETMQEELKASGVGSSLAGTLRQVLEKLKRIDDLGIGASPDQYAQAIAILRELPGEVDADRAIQVDMIKRAESVELPASIAKALFGAIDVLNRFHTPEENVLLTSFRESFLARYDRAFVPLLDALNEETGIGFGPRGSYESAATRGLPIERLAPMETIGELTPLHNFLLDRIMDCARQGKTELRLALTEVPETSKRTVEPPSSFCLNMEIVADSAQSASQGEFEILVNATYGPDGARTLARFCHADPELTEAVRKYLTREEELFEGCIVADVVHLPEGRTGNVLLRPCLRKYEIVFMGGSGLPDDRQILATDLLVGVDDKDEVYLYSKRLGQRVIPRLTTAHGFLTRHQSPVYKFLGCLQHQRGVSAPKFSWGPLASLRFLPRLIVDKTVLSPARWRINRSEIEKLTTQEGHLRFRAVQLLRQREGFPRFIEFEQSDMTLITDLNNPLSVDALVHVLARESDEIVLREVFPDPEMLCASSPEGRFWHEIDMPFIKRSKDAVTADARASYSRSRGRYSDADRSFPPGSDWLSSKLYGGSAVLDEILLSEIQTAVSHAIQSGIATSWFFIRYADPDFHIRLRLRASNPSAVGELLNYLGRVIQPLTKSGRLWKVQFDTYVREIERYGGPEGMRLSEELFFADSQAVARALASGDVQFDVNLRWRIALLGIDSMFDDFGLTSGEKLEISRSLCDSYLNTFKSSDSLRRALGEKFRSERRQLETMRQEYSLSRAPWSSPARAFADRSTRLRRYRADLEALAAASKLNQPVSALLRSYAHMHVNRVMRASANEHELVLYYFLSKLYESDVRRQPPEILREALPA